MVVESLVHCKALSPQPLVSKPCLVAIYENILAQNMADEVYNAHNHELH